VNTFDQVVLDLSGPVPANFDTFIPGPNAAVVAIARAMAQGDNFDNQGQSRQHHQSLSWMYITGRRGSGRTHLLFACCQAARDADLKAVYISYQRRPPHLPIDLEGIEDADLVALDDVDAIAGEKVWEEGLFHFLNRARSRGTALIMAASQTPVDAGFTLPDLRSRLNWGQRYWLQPLADGDLEQVVRTHAASRRLPINEKTLSYLLNNGPSNAADQLLILDQLEKAAFANKRKPSLNLAVNIVQRFMAEQ